MARVSKDPEERKNEIMDVAEEMFATKGFENTAISDIVKKVGVAQGLFYYYFKTKNQILDAIADRFLKKTINEIERISRDETLDSNDRINKVIDIILGTATNTGRYVPHANNGKNSGLHLRFEKRIMEKLAPLISEIIKKGIEDKTFGTRYPMETARLILVGIGHFHNYTMIEDEQKGNSRMDNIQALKEIINSMLGAKS